MFGHYFELAIRGLRRDIALTLLMVLAIAIGIGASMTELTVFHVLASDPYPGRSTSLYRPQLDPRRLDDRDAIQKDNEPYFQLSWTDADNLLRAARADRQTAMSSSAFRIEPARPRAEITPLHPAGLLTTADFFAMFDAPFRYGGPWSATDDASEAPLIVISDSLNQHYFAGADSTGQVLLINGLPFRIVGVLAPWRVLPRVYGTFSPVEYDDRHDAYLPLRAAIAAGIGRAGSYQCWDPKHELGRGPSMKTAPCAWLSMWVQLDSPAKARAYHEFLDRYSREQKDLGRFERAPNSRLRSLPQWLDYQHAVPVDVRLQAWLAQGFLLVCLINAVGLMLARFMRRANEFGVRRALGAARRDVFMQLLVEAAVIGLAGGIVGVMLAYAGLWLVRQQTGGPVDFASLAYLDTRMLIATVALAVCASLAVGLLPAWRACQSSPALQLKTR